MGLPRYVGGKKTRQQKKVGNSRSKTKNKMDRAFDRRALRMMIKNGEAPTEYNRYRVMEGAHGNTKHD